MHGYSALLERRILGHTDLAVSLLGLGTVKLGRNIQVKYPAEFTLPDDKAAAQLLAVARDLGVNLIDTAPAYGTSESRLGKLLTGQRQDWVIATKVGEEFDGTASHFDFSPQHCVHSVERSLQRLDTDYLDLVLIHSDGEDEKILHEAGTLDALQDLKRRGLVRYSGISHKSAHGGYRALQLGPAAGVDVIMATLNSAHTEEQQLIADAGEQGVGVLVKKALASGHGNAADLHLVAASPGVSSIVVGTTNPEHLLANATLLSS
ncbi:MAG: aldo/keto reductase [Pseudomonadota bacterium]